MRFTRDTIEHAETGTGLFLSCRVVRKDVLIKVKAYTHFLSNKDKPMERVFVLFFAILYPHEQSNSFDK